MLLIVIVVVSIIIHFLFAAFWASEMQAIAKEKGSTKKFWAWCFWTPIYGFMLVNSLPDRKFYSGDQKEELCGDELPQI